jgi:Abortive infection alpha
MTNSLEQIKQVLGLDKSDALGLGKISESTVSLVKEGREFLTNLLGPVVQPAGEQIGKAIADPIRRMRLKRELYWLETLGISKQQIDLSGKEITGVKLKTLVQIMDYASAEENESLRNIWAKLLASAATGFDVHPRYPELIKQLHPNEGKILELVYKKTVEEKSFILLSQISKNLKIDVQAVGKHIQNLHALNLCCNRLKGLEEAFEIPESSVADCDFVFILGSKSVNFVEMDGIGFQLMEAIKKIEHD